MESQFLDYSKYYDLLYREKDYTKEVEYIRSLITKFASGARSVLDIGCGTGKHAALMSNHGFDIEGMDLSAQMIDIAKTSFPSISFSQGDIRDFKLPRKYDVITSLFHVMSYQTTDEDILSAFMSVNSHLQEDGVFIFDYWYGPAVIADPPGIRIRDIFNEDYRILRLTTPEWDMKRSVIDVHFDVNVIDKNNREIQTIKEKHSMRYFFNTELKLFARLAGFQVLDMFKWMTLQDPDTESWYVVLICKKTR